jgi:hypothetical protein
MLTFRHPCRVFAISTVAYFHEVYMGLPVAKPVLATFLQTIRSPLRSGENGSFCYLSGMA